MRSSVTRVASGFLMGAVFTAASAIVMAVSFVVTGTVWGWILNPGLGLQSLVRGFGWPGFRFDWIVDRDMAIYTVVIAAVWQASGFAMSLFLAGLRSLDGEIYKAAQIDGAGPVRLVGHSRGGHIAFRVAERHPELPLPPGLTGQGVAVEKKTLTGAFANDVDAVWCRYEVKRRVARFQTEL